jgi:hypothetical protein
VSRNVIVGAASFLGAVMLSLVGLKLAASSPTDGGSGGPPSASMTADKTAVLLEAGKSDKELIAKQKNCPVTGKPLGSMGQPVKIVAKGRTVFLCCKGCKQRFLANVDNYLKKIDEQK